jgi:hypothetical protein
MYKIYVRAQSEPKIVNGDDFVMVGNNWFNAMRQVKFLSVGDDFVLDHAWYTVLSICAL